MDLNQGGLATESLTDGRERHPPTGVVTGADSAACARLVLLPRYAKQIDISVVADDDDTTTSSVSVSSCTSTGRRFRLSFGLVPSPGISSFCYSWEDPQPGDHDRNVQCPLVIAAQGDCILIEVTTPPPANMSSSSSSQPADYFLYQASSASGHPSPSLMLLPPCYIPQYYDRHHGREESLPNKPRCMLHGETAILRRGHGEDDDDMVVVAQLETPEKEDPEICLLRLRHGRDSQWQLKKMPIVVANDYDDKGSIEDLLSCWSRSTAFAVGNRFLCWVDYHRGLLFIDMAVDDDDKACLRLRYASLPVESTSRNPDAIDFDGSDMAWTRNMAPAGDSSARYVDVQSRCCCGDSGSTSCERGRFLFTVTTWTLKLSVDDDHEPMEWVKDGVLDCDELWAQPGYTGLPRVTVEYPIVVDLEDPDPVSFVVRTDYLSCSTDCVDKKVWTILVDTRRKVLRSVVPFNGSGIHHPSYSFFPAKIQY